MWSSTPTTVTTRVGTALLVLTNVILLIQHVVADCECGYSASVSNSSSDGAQQEETFVFTDLIEANFANISDISKDTDWVRQEFNKSAAQARGTYGQKFAVDNVETRGRGDGLQIVVQSDVVEGMLSGGEIDSARLDVSYGTFRSSLRLTDVGGTVCRCPGYWIFYAVADECFPGLCLLLGKSLRLVLSSFLFGWCATGRWRSVWPHGEGLAH